MPSPAMMSLLVFFRYVVGGKLLTIFTEFYASDEIHQKLISTLTPSSPQWVGAWWLGFLLVSLRLNFLDNIGP